jgi:hypothetical protein
MILDILEEILGWVLGLAFVGAMTYFVVRNWKAGSRDAVEVEREERSEAGQCVNCGYDLRGGHEACPECGAPVAKPVSEAVAEVLDDGSTELNPHALRDNWPIDAIVPRQPRLDEIPTPVFTTLNILEANLLVQQLTARGIMAVSKSREEFRVSGSVTRRLNHLLIVVPSDDKELSESIIDRFRWKRKTDADAETESDKTVVKPRDSDSAEAVQQQLL